MATLHPFRAPVIAALAAAAAAYSGWHSPIHAGLFVGAVCAIVFIGDSIISTMNHYDR